MGYRGLGVIRMGDFIHVSNHAVDGQDLFASTADRQMFLDLLGRFSTPSLRIVAWSLVGNHFHILFELRGAPRVLADFLRNVESAYAEWFNHKYARRGALHWRRYDRRATRSELGTRVVTAYIHANRVKDGFCSDPTTDPWSSHPDYLGLCEPRLVDLSHRDALFGGVEGYLASFAELLPRWSDNEPWSIYEQLVLDRVEAHMRGRPTAERRYVDAVKTAALIAFADATPARAARRVGLDSKNGARSHRRAHESVPHILEGLDPLFRR